MTTVDYSARLTLVQAAITAILTGGVKSYDVEGQQVTKLDLPDLLQQERELIGQINRQRRGGAFRTVNPA